MKENLRAIVLEGLLEAEKGGTMPGSLLRRLLNKYAYLENRDRAFIKVLFEGTTERRITLDYVIDRFSRVKTEKMKPVIREILRLSTYQLLYMDHVPARAVLNEAVKLTRKKHLEGLTGFVNGVLRKISAEETDLNAIPDLSVRYSMPSWITERLLSAWGEAETEEILRASLEKRPLYIRMNPLRTDRESLIRRLREEGAEAEEISGFPGALLLRLTAAGSLEELPSFMEGLFSVQDLSSQEAGLLAAPEKGGRVIDVCASPGGKACHMAESMGGTGSVEARDISEWKAERIRENADRLRLSNLSVRVRDARILTPESEETADLVIADLPCSGLGVMGRKSDLKYRVKEEDIAALRELQREILGNAVRYVKPGGKLLFSVCTITEEETTAQRDWIRDTWGLRILKEKLTLPQTGGPDGFYFVLFRKEEKPAGAAENRE